MEREAREARAARWVAEAAGRQMDLPQTEAGAARNEGVGSAETVGRTGAVRATRAGSTTKSAWSITILSVRCLLLALKFSNAMRSTPAIQCIGLISDPRDCRGDDPMKHQEADHLSVSSLEVLIIRGPNLEW